MKGWIRRVALATRTLRRGNHRAIYGWFLRLKAELSIFLSYPGIQKQK